jgi:hypothetical protein
LERPLFAERIDQDWNKGWRHLHRNCYYPQLNCQKRRRRLAQDINRGINKHLINTMQDNNAVGHGAKLVCQLRLRQAKDTLISVATV